MFGIRRCVQEVRGVGLGEEIAHARLDDGTPTRSHGFYLRQADRRRLCCAPVREAGCGDSARAKPEYANRWTRADTLFLFFNNEHKLK
jgi:hypothetical protein